MRFRLATRGTGGQQLGDGVGNFFRSLAMAPLYAAQGAEDAQSAEQKRRLQQSQIDENQAQIGTHLANAAIKEQEAMNLKQRPDFLRIAAASRAGVSVPELTNAMAERFNGAPDMGPPLLSPPIVGVGPSGRTAAIDDALSNFFFPAMASPDGKTNFEQLAKARGEYQDQGILDQAVQAANSGNYMGSSALSAVRGKKEFTPFKAVGNTGTALNEVNGEQPTTNPAMFTLFGKEGNALVGQRDAAAGASRAAAGASGALAGLRGVQTTNAKTQGEIDALDRDAAKAGKPLPSTNKVSRAADSTNAKLDNQIYSAMMKDPAWSNAPDDEFTAELVRRRSLTPAAAKAGAPADGSPAPAPKPAPGAKKPVDMTAANQVKADFKAGKISMQQAKAKLQQLGMD